MTPTFCCGFECGTFGAHWNDSGGATFTTSSPLTDLRSIQCNPSGTVRMVQLATALGAGLFVFRFRIKLTTLPSATTAIGRVNAINAGAYFKQSDSKIYAGVATGTLGTTGIAITTGIEYIIDIRVNATANPWLTDVQVNGQACSQHSNAVAANTSAQILDIGFSTSCTADALFDDVIVSATSADYPIGEGRVYSHVPNADGTHTSTLTNIVKGTLGAPTGGGAITSSTTDAFNWVNARPILGGASDANRLINQQSNASTEYVEVAFEQTTQVNPPRAVEILTADRQAATQTGNFQTKLNDNGTENAIANRGTVAGVTSDRYVTKQYATMVGGGAWTLARFNALKARFGYSSDAAPDQYWRGIMIEAEFPPSLPAGMYGEPNGPLGQSQIQQLLGQ